MNDQHDLEVILLSRFPIVLIETHEEARVLDLLERVCNLRGLALFHWNIAQGLKRHGRPDRIPETKEPAAALKHIEDTRAEILRIHLVRRRQAPEQFDLHRLALACAGFSGAEIEQAVVSALYEAVAEKRPLSSDLLLTELGRTRPLSVVMDEKLQALRGWAAERTVMAN